MQKTIKILVSLAIIGSLLTSPARAVLESTKLKIASSGTGGTTGGSKHYPCIGLALGGGGSRGSAHVGVLKVLLEEHIPIDIIAGTSIGSVVGGFYAAGVPMEQISEMFEKNQFSKEFVPLPPLARITLEPLTLAGRLVGYRPYDGFYYGWKFRDYANKATGNKNIEQLKIPYAAVVTDVVSGKSCRLTEGNLGLAMQASTAVPVLKKPVQIGDRLYCDGGTVNNVPVNHAREMGSDFVIAVDIDEDLKDVPIDKFRAYGSMAKQLLRIQLAATDIPSCQKADIFIHPDTTGINLVSRKKSDGQLGIDAGVKAARAAMPEIKRKLAAMGVTL